MCSSLDALDYARDFINSGRIHTGLVGAVEDFSIEAFLGCYKLGYLSGSNGHQEPVSCPFDKRRNGIVFSEGSVTFIVEELEKALNRKAPIYGSILGLASTFDPGHAYKYDPAGLGMERAMKMALKDAALDPEDIDCIFANANSTQNADKIESKAIQEVFGKNSRKIPVTSIKSNLGESFSVSGAFSLAAALGALQKGFIPPLINFSKRDTLCDLNFVINHRGIGDSQDLTNIMVNTFSSNGANSVLIVGKLK